MAREMILAVFIGQDGVVDVIVYSRPIDSKTGTLFCSNNALVRFVELRQNKEQSATIHNEAIINSEAFTSVPISFAIVW